MVGAGGADANADADADATSSRFGSKCEAEETAAAAEEDVDVTLSGQASNLPMRTAASLSRDGDDELDCHRRVAPGWFWRGAWFGQAKERRGCLFVSEVGDVFFSFFCFSSLPSFRSFSCFPSFPFLPRSPLVSFLQTQDFAAVN